LAERIKYAAVGCGGMGRRHLRGAAVLHGSSFANMELVACCDLKKEQAELYADEAKELLGTRPKVFTDIESMVREVPDLQAADVTVESGFHHTVAIACLEAGLHVMCEKPLAVTVRGCTLMIDAAKKRNRILSTAENFRRDPLRRLAKALIDDGAIGTPRLITQHFFGGRDRISMTVWRHMKNTASMPIDAGVHEADQLRFFMGEFKWVFGESRLHEKVRHKGEAFGGGPGGFYAAYRDSMPEQIEPTGDDALYAHVGFESGAIGQWIDDHAAHGIRRDERLIFGSKGTLDCSGNRNGRPLKLHLSDGITIDDGRILDYAPSYRLSPLAAELFGGERIWSHELDFPSTDWRVLALEYHELGECVRTTSQPEISGEEGRLNVALVYAPFEAGRLGRPVTREEMLSGRADAYQREIDEALGILVPARA
jgi:predicted dehydrogenase